MNTNDADAIAFLSDEVLAGLGRETAEIRGVHPNMVGAAYVAGEKQPGSSGCVHLSLLSIMSASEQMFFAENHRWSSHAVGTGALLGREHHPFHQQVADAILARGAFTRSV